MDRTPENHAAPGATYAGAQPLGRAAVRALYAEIALEPKPGLAQGIFPIRR